MPTIPQRTPQVLSPHWSDLDTKIYCGDAVKILQELPVGSVDLLFADPPYNIGYDYAEYKDTRPKGEYLGWVRQWLTALRRVANHKASLYVASGVKYQAEIKILMDETGWKWRDTIVWHYQFGPRQETKFTPSWVALHYATVSDKYTWNPNPIRVPSARLLKYRDKRAVAGGKVPNNVWALLPEEDPETFYKDDSNAWHIPRVCGTFKARVDFPCQLPLALLDRIIKVSSNEGDTVLDPFLGSGTTVVAARKLKRKSIGIELTKQYVDEVVLPRLITS